MLKFVHFIRDFLKCKEQMPLKTLKNSLNPKSINHFLKALISFKSYTLHIELIYLDNLIWKLNEKRAIFISKNLSFFHESSNFFYMKRGIKAHHRFLYWYLSVHSLKGILPCIPFVPILKGKYKKKEEKNIFFIWQHCLNQASV